MKKKLLAALLIALCTVSAAGCQSGKASDTDTESKTESKDKKKEKKDEKPKDLGKAVKAADTKLEKPAALGQWVEMTQKSLEDFKYHTAYVKVTKVTSASEDKKYVNSCIAENNKNGSNVEQIDVSKMRMPDDVEVTIVDYDIYIPGEFPESSYGISEPKVEFKAKSLTGGGFPATDGKHQYLGMGNVGHIMMPEDAKYEAGRTYSFKGYFAMVKGYKNFVMNCALYPDGGDTSSKTSDVFFAVQ